MFLMKTTDLQNVMWHHLVKRYQCFRGTFLPNYKALHLINYHTQCHENLIPNKLSLQYGGSGDGGNAEWIFLSNDTHHTCLRVSNLPVEPDIQGVATVICQTQSHIGHLTIGRRSYCHLQLSLQYPQLPESRAISHHHTCDALLNLQH